jgi:hypothetical protein
MQTETITEKNIASTMICNVPWHVTKVKPLKGYKLDVEFIDGTHGFVEMKRRVTSLEAGVFAKLKDVAVFNQAHIECGAVTWPNEIDLAPDAMYDEIKSRGVWILT